MLQIELITASMLGKKTAQATLAVPSEQMLDNLDGTLKTTVQVGESSVDVITAFIPLVDIEHLKGALLTRFSTGRSL